MTLKFKVIIFTFVLLVATAAVNYAVLYSFIMPAFAELEQERADQDVRRIQGVFRAEIRDLRLNAIEWGVSAETYNFIMGPDPSQKDAYQQFNLTYDTLEELDLHLFLIYDSQNNLVWSMGRAVNDTEISIDEIFHDVPTTLQTYLADGQQDTNFFSGLMTTSQGPVLIVTHRILRNGDSLPSAGTIVLGRLLSQQDIERFERQVQGEVDFIFGHDLDLGLSLEDWGSLQKDYTKTIQKFENGHILTYAAIPNMLGQAEVLIRIHTLRDITIAGSNSALSTILVMFVIGMITLVIVRVFVKVDLIKPMNELSDVMESLMEGKHNIDVPVYQKHHEFGRIARTLEVFRQNLQERSKVEMSLQRAYEELEQEHAIQEQLTHQLAVAKDEAEMSSRTKTAFLANMSHELRTPLNAVIGFSTTMEKEVFGPLGHVKYKEYARDIAASGEHLLSIIDDILDVSKVEAGKLDLLEEVVDIEDIVQSAMSLTHERTQHAGVNVRVELAEGLPRLNADRRKLKQVLLNLVSNAIKFTDAGGNVTVSVSCVRDGGVMIVVADTGIGIAAHVLEKVLAPFGRANTPRDRNYEGTGLGLPLSKSFIELHGGTLTINSVLGTGTEITVYLPKSRTIRASTSQMSS